MPRLIAFYLPQYHPTPENDEWWGKGFTEWRNVVKGKPLFKGHYQPHFPGELGFYDLRIPEVRESQAELAREYGIYGFCYYHYWFNGRRILERPFNEVLSSGKPDFPFCICWANENWTRVWDGGSNQILLAQNYSHEDDLNHINSLIPALRDSRYIRINGKPLLLVYRSEHMPDPSRTAEIWREAAYSEGIGEIYLSRVESFGSGVDPRTIGFDASTEFAPDWKNRGSFMFRHRHHIWGAKLGLMSKVFLENDVFVYQDMIDNMMKKPLTEYVRFRCVTPGFDNSVRRSTRAAISYGSTPERFGAWLNAVKMQTEQTRVGEERIAFINAWNEWAEGNHLEPDLKWGRGYLEATRNALQGDRHE
jgi:lipopolysaccharide biosynthesis protein